MKYLVAYDVSDPRRLRSVAKVCEDYGLRLQKSVFECDLSRIMVEEMMRRLEIEIDPRSDSLASIPICANCSAGRIILGVPLFSEIPNVLVA